jgi:hypothetical protein
MTDTEKLELLLLLITTAQRRKFEDVVRYIENREKAKAKK